MQTILSDENVLDKITSPISQNASVGFSPMVSRSSSPLSSAIQFDHQTFDHDMLFKRRLSHTDFDELDENFTTKRRKLGTRL